MNRGFGVQVTVDDGDGPVVRPLVVVARDERDAELVAVTAAGGRAESETLRELSADEIVEYGLDLEVHGDARSLPTLNL